MASRQPPPEASTGGSVPIPFAAAGSDGAARRIGCPDCGALQAFDSLPSSVVICGVCHSELERTRGRNPSTALACSLATVLLLLPANLTPFLTTTVAGVARQSLLISSGREIWSEGWPVLGGLIVLLVIVLPAARFSLLTAVLGCLHLGVRPRWLGRAFRWADTLQPWAMPEVFLLGLWVAYARLQATISVELGTGAYCLIAVGVLSLLVRASLDKAAIWRWIGPDPQPTGEGPLMSCLACDGLVTGDGASTRCPRCSALITARRRDAVPRTMALTLAGFILYVPANLFAIATLPIGLHPTRYTVLQGVIDLSQAKLFGLAVLVFCASFAIPFLKLLGVGYCLSSVLRRSTRRLRFKTWVYRGVEEIGRWSMVDIFVIGCFVPVMQYNTLIRGRAEAAAPAFAAVVILTMLAARTFDPRLIWDAAGRTETVHGFRS